MNNPANMTTFNPTKHFAKLGFPLGKRMNRTQHHDTSNRVIDALRRNGGIPASYMTSVQSFQSRNDFGDVDIIVVKDALPSGNWRERFATRVFASKHHGQVPDTNITVFEYLGAQINLHVVDSTNDLQKAGVFLNNQGMSKLISIMVEPLGLLYDATGIRLRTGGSGGNLLIPHQHYNELRLSGISLDYYVYYIYTDIDAFKGIYTSPFFNRKTFLDLESKPEYAQMVEDNPLLGRFVTYLKGNSRLTGEAKFSEGNKTHVREFNRNFMSYAGSTYTIYTEMLRRNKILEMVQSKYTVEKMAKVTGLEDKRLKLVMDTFAQKGFKSEKEFNMYIVTSLPTTIEADILKLRDEIIKAEEAEAKVKAEAEAQKLEAVKETKGKTKAKTKVKAKKEPVEKQVKPVAKRARGQKVVLEPIRNQEHATYEEALRTLVPAAARPFFPSPSE